jgi:hypothetical protein
MGFSLETGIENGESDIGKAQRKTIGIGFNDFPFPIFHSQLLQ